jgi:response regulator RpfG family c-di-GMP phosphodiesterase
VLTAVKPAVAPLRVLLVGKKEEDFFLIRGILDRMRSMLSAELEHAHSLEEAKEMLQERPYGLVLFEHETGDARAVHLLAYLLHVGVSIPYIVLTEHPDEHTIAEIIEGELGTAYPSRNWTERP